MAKFKMWYIPQVPMHPFEVECETAEQALDALDLITDFSIFEFENNIKPDYSDAGGVMVWDEAQQEWFDWDEEEEARANWAERQNQLAVSFGARFARPDSDEKEN